MGKPKQNRSAHAKSGSTVDKGRMLEKIVAAMHQQEGAVTETNVRLPPINNAKGQKREIDVLVTSTLFGYTIRLAFECKNEGKLTGTQDIDIFARKLDYVGIPKRQGIFVSAAGYTRGAIENANDCGIQVLTYENLDHTLRESVMKVITAVVHVQCFLQGISFMTAIPHSAEDAVSPDDLHIVYLEEYGRIVGVHIADLVWLMWGGEDSIPDRLGIHEISIPFSNGAFWLSNGKRYPITSSVNARVRISAIVFRLEGKVIGKHRLVNTQTSALGSELTDIAVGFDSKSQVEMRVVRSEQDLAHLVEAENTVPLVKERIRLPRIVFDNTYWPRSQRVIDKMMALIQADTNAGESQPQTLGFAELEGAGLEGFVAAREPIAPGWSLGRPYPQRDFDG